MHINSLGNNVCDAKNINTLKTDVNSSDKPMPSEGLSDEFVFSSSDSAVPSQKNFADKLLGLLDFPAFVASKVMSEGRRQQIMDVLKPGDIILETNDNRPAAKLLEKAAVGSDYTHASFYEGGGKFIEANIDHNSGYGVDRLELFERLKGRLSVKIIRPPYKSQEDVNAALDYARNQIGKPYDFMLDNSTDDRLYCSELIAKSLKAMPNKVYTPVARVFGQELIVPEDFGKIDGAEVVYDDKSSFWKGQLRMTPAFAGGAAVAVGAGLLFGPLGAVLGFVAGTAATTIIGGKIQEKSINKDYQARTAERARE